MKNRCVIFSANRGFALMNSRLPLMESLLSQGWRVVVATANDEYAGKLANKGIIIESVHFNRGGFSPKEDFIAYSVLRKIYKNYKPLLIHHFHAKPVILGTLAARHILGKEVKIVNSITGLGHAFTKGGISKQLASVGYHFSIPAGDVTIFQNRDDRQLFIKQGWVTPEQAQLIVSSGVDITRFHPVEKLESSQPKLLMVGRLLWQKGVGEFIEAAKIVKKHFPNVRFQLAGEWDFIHPDAISKKQLDEPISKGIIEFLGYIHNMDEELPKIDLLVMPSYYREGVPRVVLEAAACGIPCIGADVPGTREAISDEKTGFLVPPQDSKALAKRILDLLKDNKLRQQMGNNARKMVEEQFDIKIITRKQLSVYKKIGVG
ncbi:MAG: glycosyltransferase family 4 protein [Bacteroidales bacterium]|nr:glycosyltransferase family 4 protein [Bacteroidales bacterium]